MIIAPGDPQFDEYVSFFRRQGSTSAIHSLVLIAVERALPVVSPAYDGGATEEEIRARWQRYLRTPSGNDALDG